MINKYLDGINKYHRGILIFVLAYMAIWQGTLQCDASMALGKNVINFFLIYTIGNTLSVYQERWKRIGMFKLIISYIALNSVLLISWMAFKGRIADIIMRISFPYCSPLLYLNAILLFMIFGKLNLKSKVINYFASSIFAVYLLHCQPWILDNVISKGANAILSISYSSEVNTIVLFGLYAMMIIVACVFIDKLLSPLWKVIANIAGRIEQSIFNKILTI